MKFSKSRLLIGALAASIAVLLVVRPGFKHDRTEKVEDVSSLVSPADGSSATVLSQPQAERAVPQVAKAQPNIAATLGEFGIWAEKFSKAATEQERGSLLSQGEALAEARREQLKKLMQSNPALALGQLVPYSLRKRLPASVKQ